MRCYKKIDNNNLLFIFMVLHSILNLVYPRVISNIIVEYDINVCNNCKKETRDWSACIRCNVIRCSYCHAMNSSDEHCKRCIAIDDYSKQWQHQIKCVNHSDQKAMFGYKDIICYCELCIHDKKVIEYNECFDCNYGAEFYDVFDDNYYCSKHVTINSRINYIDTRINIPNTQLLEQCCSCKKRITIAYSCTCGKKRCLHCFKLEAFYYDDHVICTNKCGRYTLNSPIRTYINTVFPCTICSIFANYVDIVNNKYYCAKHKTQSNKHIYGISFTVSCLYCPVPAFDEFRLCIRHLRAKMKIYITTNN